ncbi:MAG: hypothetical protein AAF081_04535 [Actinomycetota bacterium]
MSARLSALIALIAVVAAACGGSSTPTIQAQASTTTTTTTIAAEEAEREVVSITELSVGMCSDTADIDTARDQLTLVDCDRPHRYEVFAAVPGSAVVVGDDGLAAAVQEACELVSEAETGIRPQGSLIGVIGFSPPDSDGATCVWEAPDQRVDFFARAPLDLPAVQVNRTQLDGASTTSFAFVSDVAGDGDDVVVLLGQTDRTDPGGLDGIIWRSVNGGDSFAAVTDSSLQTRGTAEVPEAIEPIASGYLVIGTRYGDLDPQPWALVSDTVGQVWTPLAVPLDGNAGAELRFAVTRADGTVEVIGSVYDRRGLRRPVVWTWGGFSLSQPVPLVSPDDVPDANVFVEAAFVDSTGVTVYVSDLFANRRSGFRSSTPGAWSAFSDVPALQFTTVVVDDATFAIRGGELTRQETPGGGWDRVELPGHDGARPDPVAVATDGSGVLAIGALAAVEGTSSAFWYRPAGGEFELIYFDVDQAPRDDRPFAATAVAGGFLVVGSEDPEYDGLRAPVAWTIDGP